MSGLKQTMSTRDMLSMAYSDSETTTDKKFYDAIEVDPEVLTDDMATIEVAKPKVEYSTEYTSNETVETATYTPQPVADSTPAYEPQPEPVVSTPIETYNIQEPLVAPTPPQPTPVAQEPVEQPMTSSYYSSYTPESAPKPPVVNSINLDANMITQEVITKVIGAYELYRSYPEPVRHTVSQYLGIEKDTGDAFVIYKLFDLESDEKNALSKFVELKKTERYTRSFDLIGLYDTNPVLLDKVRDLAQTFNAEFKPTIPSGSKIDYCKEIEVGIEMLDSRALTVLDPITKLFEQI